MENEKEASSLKSLTPSPFPDPPSTPCYPKELTNGARLFLGSLAAALRFLTTNDLDLQFAVDCRGEPEAGPSKTRYVLPQLPEGSPLQLCNVVVNHLMALEGPGTLRFPGQGRKTKGLAGRSVIFQGTGRAGEPCQRRPRAWTG